MLKVQQLLGAALCLLFLASQFLPVMAQGVPEEPAVNDLDLSST